MNFQKRLYWDYAEIDFQIAALCYVSKWEIWKGVQI